MLPQVSGEAPSEFSWHEGFGGQGKAGEGWEEEGMGWGGDDGPIGGRAQGVG